EPRFRTWRWRPRSRGLPGRPAPRSGLPRCRPPRGRRVVLRSWAAPAAVDPLLFEEGVKVLARAVGQALAPTKHEETSRAQALGEGAEDPLPEALVEVERHVAAEDQVHLS